ncbi:MAG: hypothetical protein JSS61_00080 [Verrucomicrobia bacterium]|nr:hypothetical protein [Verrucomicrobiota bacterium]
MTTHFTPAPVCVDQASLAVLYNRASEWTVPDEHGGKQVRAYIKTILQDADFLRDSTAFVRAWTERRVASLSRGIESFPQDAALRFFIQNVVLAAGTQPE